MPPKKKAKSASLDGQVFCFTGFRDAELEKLIQAAGGQVAASVTKAVTTVVCKTGAEDTKKVQDAEAKGLTVMTKEELQELLGGVPSVAAPIKAAAPPKAAPKASASAPSGGDVYCFTGFRDAELEKLIRAAGGQVAASMTKAVTIVVCKTGAENTKKVQDAEERGLTIMTKEELEEQFGAGNENKGKRKASHDADEDGDEEDDEQNEMEEDGNGKPIAGQVFCFTGFRDAELEKLIRAAGGQVAASMTKAVTTVVCKTGAEDTKKVQDAEAKGLTIMTKEELQQLLGGGCSDASSGSHVGPYFTPEFLASFWDTSSTDDVMPYPTDEDVAEVEEQLGYKLPAAYVELMRSQNGGVPNRTAHRATKTSWSDNHIAMTSFFGIGSSVSNSLCGDSGHEHWIDEWEYPKIGIYFADCPSGGHDMLALDYRQCGKKGEPRVVHVDQEFDYKVTVLAKDFASFVKGLVDEDSFEENEGEDEDEQNEMEEDGNSKPIAGQVFCFTGFRDAELEKLIRAAGGQVAASMTKAVTTVVCKTGAENTKKVQDAEERGLTIMTKEELEERFA